MAGEGWVTLDNSTLASKRVCTTQWALQYVLGLVPKDERADTKAGKAIHAGIAEFRRGKPIGDCLKAFDAGYREWSETHPTEERLSWANLNDIVAYYIAVHQTKAPAFRPIVQYVESGITIPLMDGVNMFALIDCPAQDASTGALLVVDTKCTGKISSWWMRKWRLSSQNIEYAWVMQTAFGQECSRVFIDAIEMSKLPDDSDRKCATHKMPQRECRLLHAKWELLTVAVNEEKKQNWLRLAQQTARECVALAPAVKAMGIAGLKAWPQEGMFSNGCTFCDYADICAGDRSPQLIESLLTFRPWQPWVSQEQALEE